MGSGARCTSPPFPTRKTSCSPNAPTLRFPGLELRRKPWLLGGMEPQRSQLLDKLGLFDVFALPSRRRQRLLPQEDVESSRQALHQCCTRLGILYLCNGACNVARVTVERDGGMAQIDCTQSDNNSASEQNTPFQSRGLIVASFAKRRMATHGSREEAK